MKKVLLVIAGLALFSANAEASKARLMSLSQGENGSYFLLDNRNMFYNPSVMMLVADHANLEAGTTDLQSGEDDLDANAEGGFIKTMGSVKVGFQVGKETQTADNVADVNADLTTAGAGTFLAPNNAFELSVAGGDGLKWGASLLYAATDKQSTEQKADIKAVRVGATQDNWSAWLNFGLGSNLKGLAGGAAPDAAEFEYKGTMGIRVGGAYALNNNQKVFLNYESDGFTVTSDTSTISSQGDGHELEVKGANMILGYADVADLGSGNTFFWSAGYETKMRETDGDKTDEANLPVTIGFEGEATSWLVLRGSVTQSILISSVKDTDNTDTHATNTTAVAAGAGLKFGKLTVDGTLAGMTGAAATGEVSGDTLLAHTSLTYNF